MKERPRQYSRSGRAKAVADIVPDIGRAAFRRYGFVQSSVVSRWPEIVGETYAEVSAPESIRFQHGKRGEGVLTVIVEGAYAVMVQHVAPEIIERVNRFFGYRAVARIAIRQGRVEPRRAPSPRALKLEDLPADMSASLKPIVDDGLRACLESLALRLCASEGPPVISNLSPLNLPISTEKLR